MDAPLYEHQMVVAPLLEKFEGKPLSNEYSDRIMSCDSCPDIGFLSTIRYAKRYLESQLDARADEAHYLALITMDDWKKNRSHPELSDAAFEGPMSENAYPEDRTIEIDGKEVSMNDIARRYNKTHGQVDAAAEVPWTEEEANPDSRNESRQIESSNDDKIAGALTLEDLMVASPLQVLQIMPAILERSVSAEEASQIVDHFYDEAQQGDYRDLYSLTVNFARKYLARELEVTAEDDRYLAIAKSRLRS